MNMKTEKRTLLFLTLFITVLPVFAQFNTVTFKKTEVEYLPGYDSTKVAYVDLKSVSDTILDKDTLVYDDNSFRSDSISYAMMGSFQHAIDSIVYMSYKDSLLAEVLSERLNVCLPLDYIYVTSKYGYRNDPLGKGRKFHDGIDLRCRYSPVMAMMPGVVREVHPRGGHGYGKYIIIDHDNISVRYGHLSEIGVEEGDRVFAGDVVAISGNTGRSTGPHLHIAMKINGESVNPLYFLQFINNTIDDLERTIASISEVNRPSRSLTVEHLIEEMEKVGLHHKKIVLAQSFLETYYFTSNVCKKYNNLFGLYNSYKGDYYRFDRWEDSVLAYKKYIQYRYKSGDYYDFLDRIGYAEDKNYTKKVRQIVARL